MQQLPPSTVPAAHPLGMLLAAAATQCRAHLAAQRAQRGLRHAHVQRLAVAVAQHAQLHDALQHGRARGTPSRRWALQRGAQWSAARLAGLPCGAAGTRQPLCTPGSEAARRGGQGGQRSTPGDAPLLPSRHPPPSRPPVYLVDLPAAPHHARQPLQRRAAAAQHLAAGLSHPRQWPSAGRCGVGCGGRRLAVRARQPNLKSSIIPKKNSMTYFYVAASVHRTCCLRHPPAKHPPQSRPDTTSTNPHRSLCVHITQPRLPLARQHKAGQQRYDGRTKGRSRWSKQNGGIRPEAGAVGEEGGGGGVSPATCSRS